MSKKNNLYNKLNREDKRVDSVQEVESKVYYVPYEKLDLLSDDRSPEYIQIDEIIKKIWQGKWTLFFVVMVFTSFGIFNAFFSTKQYQSNAILIPEVGSATESRTEQLLRRYGSGLGIGTMTQIPEGTIPPLLYSNIVQSTPFQLELLKQELQFQSIDEKITYKEFIQKYSHPSPVDLVKNYTIGLPGKLLSLLIQLIITDNDSTLPNKVKSDENAKVLRLTKEEQTLIDGLRSTITVEQNLDNGLISSRVIMPDPLASAELNYAVVELLKKYITDYKLQKVREDLDFTEQMKRESEQRFNDAQFALAEFLDRNKVLSTSKSRVELERLQDQRNLAFGIYNSVSQRLEQVKLQLNEQRPTFKEIQPVTVPLKPSSPQRMKLVTVYTIFGGLFGITWIFLGKRVIYFIKTLQRD